MRNLAENIGALRMLTVLITTVAVALTAGCGNRSAATEAIENDTTAVAAPQQVTLMFVGDAMQHGPQFNRARLLGGGQGYDYSGYYTYYDSLVKAVDYAVVNLEVPLGGGRGGYTGYPCFSAPDDYAVALKNAGFDLFLTSNNHTLDRSDYGLRRTLTVLDSIGVDHIGTYHDKAQRDTLVPFVKDINGIKIGFLNYTYGTNGIQPRQGAEVSLIDREAMAREIAATREAGAEVIAVCVHWGEEYQLHENKSQRDLAQYIVDNGADMVIGGHPHVVQPMKFTEVDSVGKKALIVYSLGNFISNQMRADTRGGVSVTCRLERDSTGRVVITDAEYGLHFTVKPVLSTDNYHVVPSTRTDLIPASQQADFRTFVDNAERLFRKENQGVVMKE